MEIIYEVDDEVILRDILIKKLYISSRLLTKLKKEQAIYFNGKVTYVKEKVANGTIRVDLSKVDLEDDDKIKKFLLIDEKPLDIIFEDDYILCINKPTNMPVHPTALHQGNTLLEIASKYMYEKGFKGKLHIVNRLDRETSGVVILAKHAYIQECISRQMQENKTDKKYIAVIDGIINKNGIIEKNIDRKEGSIIERCVSENGDYAKTEYKVLKNMEDYTVLEIKLYTGRTHQIRVHMQSIGHSLLGDGLYNSADNKYKYINRVALHARSMEFIHPITNKKTKIVASIPEDIKKIL